MAQEQDIEHCSKAVLLFKIEDLEDELKRKEVQIRKFETDIGDLREKLTHYRLNFVENSEFQDVKTKHDLITSKYEDLSRNYANLKKDVKYYRGEHESLLSRLDSLENNSEIIKRLRAENETQKGENRLLDSANEILASKLEKSNLERDELKSELESLREEYVNYIEARRPPRPGESFDTSAISLDPNTSVLELSFQAGINLNRRPSLHTGETVADMIIPVLENEKSALQSRVQNLENENSNLQIQNSELCEDLRSKQIIIEECNSTLTALRSEHSAVCVDRNNLRDTIIPELQNENGSLQTRARELESENLEFAQKNGELQGELRSKQSLIDDLCSQIDQCNSSLSEMIVKNETICAELNQTRESNEALTRSIAVCAEESNRLEVALAESVNRAAEWELRHGDAMNQLEALKIEHTERIDRHLEAMKDFEQQIKLHLTSIDELKRNSDAKDSQIDELNQAIARASQEIALKAESNQSLQNKFDEISAQYRQKCQDFDQQMKDIEELRESNQTTIDQLNQKIAKASQEIALKAESNQSLQIKFDEISSQFRDKCQNFDQLTKDMEELRESNQKTIEKLNQAIARASQEIALKEESNQLLQIKFDKISSQYRDKCQDFDQQTKDIENLRESNQTTIDQLNQTIERSSQEIALKDESNQSLQIKFNEMSARYDEACEKLDQIMKNIDELRASNQTTIDEFNQTITQITGEINRKDDSNRLLQKQIDEITDQFNEKCLNFDQQTKDMENLRASNQTTIDEFNQKFSQTLQEISTKDDSNRLLQKQLDEISAQFNEKCQNFDQLTKDIDELRSSNRKIIDEMNQTIARLSGEINRKDDSNRLLQKQLDEISAQFNEKCQNFDQQTKDIDELRESNQKTIDEYNQKFSQTLQEISTKDDSNRLLQKQLDEISAQFSKKSQDFDQLTKDIDEQKLRYAQREIELREQLDHSSATIVELESRSAEIKSCMETTEDQFLRLNTQFTRQIGELVTLERRVEHLCQENLRTTQTIERARVDHENEIAALVADRREAEQKLNEQIAALSANRDSLNEQIGEQKRRIDELTHASEHQDSMITGLETMLAQSEARNQQLVASQKDFDQNRQKLESDLRQSEERCEKYRQLADKLAQSVDKAKREEEDDAENVVELQRKFAAAKTELRSASAEIARLKKSLEMEELSFQMERQTKERLLRENAQLNLQMTNLQKQQQQNSQPQSQPAQQQPEQRKRLRLASEDEMSCCTGGDENFRQPAAPPPLPPRNASTIAPVDHGNNHHDQSQKYLGSMFPPPVPSSRRLSSRFEMAEEEGQFMDPSTIDCAQLFGNGNPSSSSSSSSSSATHLHKFGDRATEDDRDQRIQQLQHRNSLLRPHLRSTYAVEFQQSNIGTKFDENFIRHGGGRDSGCASKSSSTSSLLSSLSSSSHSSLRPNSSIQPLASADQNLRVLTTSSSSSSSSNSSSSAITSAKRSPPRASSGPAALKAKRHPGGNLTPSKLLRRVIKSRQIWSPSGKQCKRK